MSRIVGIDFGTTNTLAAYMFDGIPRVIKSKEVEHILPSVVCKYEGKLFVGEEAKANIIAFTEGDGITEIKRKIGSSQSIYFGNKYMKPYEISAIILKKIKRNIKLYFEEDVNEVIITVPAEFTDNQRNGIIMAGKTAGFVVKKIINEPTAALLAYANENDIRNEKVLCYDFGGGTFDISIANIKYNGFKESDIEVIAVGGDRKLGGGDIDREILKYIKDDIYSLHGQAPDKYGDRQLELAVEQMKIELSSKDSATISLSHLSLLGDKKVGYFKKITRWEFENLIEKYIDRTIELVKETMSDNNILAREIDKVLLVGGSSKIPIVAQKIRSELGLNPTFGGLNPDECVSIGASIEATNLSFKGRVRSKVNIKQDVCPFAIGLKIEHYGEKDVFDPIIKKNFPYGKEYHQEYKTALNHQNSMKLEIYQGNKRRASMNSHICDFEIKDIPERYAGEETVRVYFKYDMDGILNIKGKILSTGKEVTHEYRYPYNAKISWTSKKNIDEHFIDEEKVNDAMGLVNAIKKCGEEKDTRKIYDAIKYEDEELLDSITNDLLD